MTSTTAMRFVDTNVILYAITPGPGEIAKSRLAESLLREDDLALSLQVLQEFYAQATRPKRPNHISHAEAVTVIRNLASLPVQEMTLDLFHAALATKHRFQISYWDAAVIEAARQLGCDTVLSEDLGDAQDYAGVRVVNPFANA